MWMGCAGFALMAALWRSWPVKCAACRCTGYAWHVSHAYCSLPKMSRSLFTVQACYGLPPTCEHGAFTCHRCAYLEGFASSRASTADVQDVGCCLCPRLGGLLKKTIKGTWVHMFCALMIPGVTFLSPDDLEGIDLKHVAPAVSGDACSRLHEDGHYPCLCPCAHAQRYGLNCYLCQKKKAGACLQCEDCYKAFHPMCAQQAGCYLTWQETVGGGSVSNDCFLCLCVALSTTLAHRKGLGTASNTNPPQ